MGRPPIFKGNDDFCEKFSEYIDYIFDNNFEEVISYKGFADFVKCTSKTVYKYLSAHPEVKDLTREGYADVLVVGATTGAYKSTPAIFTLKNRCGWADKVERTSLSDNNKVATKEEARAKILEIVSRKDA